MNGTSRGRAAPTILPFYSELAEPRHETQPLPARDIHTYTHTRSYIRRICPEVNNKYVREVHSDELSRRTQFRRRFLFVRATKPTWLGKRREFRPYTKYFHIPFATAAPFSSSFSLSLSLPLLFAPSVALSSYSLAPRPIPKGIGIYKEERKLRPPPSLPSFPSAGGGKAI